MGQRLASEDFESLFRYYQRTAFRLEVQPFYMVEAELEPFAEFRAGSPRVPTEVPYLAAWLDQIQEITAQGRRVERVRITDDPPNDYQRWGSWVSRWNVEAGETIHELDRAVARGAGLPLAYDWWLFDEERLAVMEFDGQGRPLGGEIVTDDAAVLQHVAWRDLAIRLASKIQQAAG